ncbi:hypothetical protein M433DRAFT_156183 [Acidomyces richmondensis BFW]|nr:MAG: hypothetical protein FE78DRAFT_92827 [Acidomyces sp. 'richmondensis']KYG43926.1 hypothetical protein M433DRAFT_156183 [Acidomyces richmondensis BFW]
MIVNKKFDRLKQWGKEKIGAEKTDDTTDEFKALEVEMQLRADGMERLDKSAKVYIKSISQRTAGEDKEKQLPITYFGNVMVSHGDDFEPDSEFGQCLSSLGRANERIGRIQETYAANATSCWLESVERAIVMQKEYASARKKLEARRLAYDTAMAKVNKSKKEDTTSEEYYRQQKNKYEESMDDVLRRMLDIKEAEADSIADLTSFLEAELMYYDRCRDVLLQLKRDWPAQASINRSGTASPVNAIQRRNTRSRASSLTQRFLGIAEDEPLEPPQRPVINSRVSSGQNSPRRELPGFDLPVRSANRVVPGFEGPAARGRELSPAGMPRLTRVPTDPSHILNARSTLRVTKRENQTGGGDVFSDDQSDVSTEAASSVFDQSRGGSWTQSTVTHDGSGRKGPPPPPPPSRTKKPPPPPPMKRSALSTSEIPKY